MKAEYEDSFTRLLFVFILRTRDSREIRRGLSLHMTDVGFVRDIVEEGKFTIVCSGGEYELSFTAIIENHM